MRDLFFALSLTSTQLKKTTDVMEYRFVPPSSSLLENDKDIHLRCFLLWKKKNNVTGVLSDIH